MAYLREHEIEKRLRPVREKYSDLIKEVLLCHENALATGGTSFLGENSFRQLSLYVNEKIEYERLLIVESIKQEPMRVADKKKKVLK